MTLTTACLSSRQVTLNARSAESGKFNVISTPQQQTKPQKRPCAHLPASHWLSYPHEEPSGGNTSGRECRAGDPWEMRRTDALRQDLSCLLRPQHQPEDRKKERKRKPQRSKEGVVWPRSASTETRSPIHSPVQGARLLRNQACFSNVYSS